MKWISGAVIVTLLAACGVDGPPIRPSVTTTVGTSTGNTNASVTNDWISGHMSTHVGVGF